MNQNQVEKPKQQPKCEQAPAHPLYNALTQQISAALIIARQIDADKNYCVPKSVRRFLNEFGQKAA